MIWRSPYPDVAIPDVPFASFVLGKARQMGDKPALIDGVSGDVITYRQLLNRVHAVAGALLERGIGKGDVVAIYSPNLPDYAVLLYGVATIGAISTTVNPLYTAGELNVQLLDTGAVILATVPELMERARQGVSETRVREIVTFGHANGATPFSSLLQCRRPVPEASIGPSEDVVVLPYSSGTTGVNKGVMLTHRNLVANLCQLDALRVDGPSDTNRMVDEGATLLGLLPFYHIYGMVVILHGALHQGATLVTLSRFELNQFLQTLEEYRVTVAHLVPPIILALAKHPSVEGRDFSTLRLIFSGAAPLDADLIRACSERIGCVVTQGFGMTETAPVTHCNTSGEPVGSVGRLLPNTESMVLAVGTEKALPPGETGEIAVRGPQVMKGYLHQPEATAAMIDQKGWLHTGDLGYADAEGNFYVVDRLKELIKYKAYQVAPAELEAVLLSHPMVADAAVVRSPDLEAGEVPKAFVVLRGEVASEELLDYVAERVAPHKKIRRLEVVDSIPKSPSGKILRRVLMEREWAPVG